MLSTVGGRYRIFCAGQAIEATMRGRLKQSRERVLVGDLVLLHLHSNGSATVERVLPRRSVLKRRSPGQGSGTRAVAANIEQVVVVGAARRPDWDPHLVDRLTAVAEANQLPPVVVVNKCDLTADCGRLLEPYRLAGYPVIETNVPARQGLEALRSHLERRISLLTGPTGVGKSSLLNALQPGLRLRTGAVSEKSRAGRHTTVAAEMHPFGTEGFVVDTPGLRDVGLWGLDPGEVAAAFPEIERAGAACRFDNCRHCDEPGCAVAEASTRGAIAKSRLDSYRALLEEAARAARPWA